jgi:hypothetical protein
VCDGKIADVVEDALGNALVPVGRQCWVRLLCSKAQQCRGARVRSSHRIK